MYSDHQLNLSPTNSPKQKFVRIKMVCTRLQDLSFIYWQTLAIFSNQRKVDFPLFFSSVMWSFFYSFQVWYTIFTASYTKYLQDHRSHKLPINRHYMSPFKHIVPRSPAFGCQPALTPNQHLGKVFCHFSPKFVKKRCECAKKDNFYH